MSTLNTPIVSTRPGAFSAGLSKPGSTLATLSVVHKCGHTQSYGYGGLEFAQKEGAHMASLNCTSCHSRSELEIFERSRRIAR